jgi:hypothetical protein
MNKEKEKEKNWWDIHKYWFVPVLFIGVVLVWGAFGFWLVDSYDTGVEGAITKNFAMFGDRGTFGDMFGAVNALFTGLAFAGLICTLIIQMQGVNTQREELAATREELAGQKDIMKKQSEQIDTQNFENGFFQVFKLHNEIVKDIKIFNASRYKYSGREAFDFIRASVNEDPVFAYNEEISQEIAKRCIKDVMLTHWGGFDEYICSFISLISFVKSSSVDENKIEYYFNFINTYISSDEYLTLCYLLILGNNESLKVAINESGLIEKFGRNTGLLNYIFDELIKGN